MAVKYRRLVWWSFNKKYKYIYEVKNKNMCTINIYDQVELSSVQYERTVLVNTNYKQLFCRLYENV